MDPYEEAVLQGQSPEWRELWEERLAPDDRRLITRSVWRGQAVTEPFHAALAAGRAHKWRRTVRINLVTLFPGHLLLVGVWIWFTCFGETRRALECGTFVTIAAVALVGVPVFASRLIPALRRAELSNRRVYERAVGQDQLLPPRNEE